MQDSDDNYGICFSGQNGTPDKEQTCHCHRLSKLIFLFINLAVNVYNILVKYLKTAIDSSMVFLIH